MTDTNTSTEQAPTNETVVTPESGTTPPVPPTEPPAPKAEPTPEPTTTTQPTKADNGSQDSDYARYDHPAADAAVDLLRTRGVLAEESSKWFEEAAQTGDVNKIDTAAIIAKLGHADGALVIAAVRDYLTGHNTSVAETVSKVYEISGGEKNFALIRDWAAKREGTDPAFAKTLNKCREMLSNGPEMASIAARELVRLYNSDSANKSLHVNLTSGDAAGLTHSYISKEDYIKQYMAASEKNDFKTMNQLDVQRKQSLLHDRKNNNRKK